jgi:SAM-dependent methyltransferase
VAIGIALAYRSVWALVLGAIAGERERVLDIASESNVTAGLDSKSVTRLDLSPDAIEYAEEVLGERVDRYEVADPEVPDLPFEDNRFDGAVSIGPYDWKFLDVDRLTEELRRVVGPDGLLVFSVPTLRSPYSMNNWNKYRYFTLDEALDLVSPAWRLADYDLVF